MLPHIAGRYYGAPQTGGSSTSAATVAGTIYLTPFLVPTDGSYDRIGARQTTNGTRLYHLGIYGPITDSYTSLPLLLDSGEITRVDIGDIEATINIALAAGWYLLALVSDGAASVLRKAAAEWLQQLGFSSLNQTAPPTEITQAGSYGPLPNPSPAAPTYAQNSAVSVSLRKA